MEKLKDMEQQILAKNQKENVQTKIISSLAF
jgi:hypothetical protein